MVKTNTSQIITMVAIFAVLIGLIIFMRRNDEKEGFSRRMKGGGGEGAEGGEGCGEEGRSRCGGEGRREGGGRA
jgi:hypothetical protein